MWGNNCLTSQNPNNHKDFRYFDQGKVQQITMKKLSLVIALLIWIGCKPADPSMENHSARQYYQLRTYSFANIVQAQATRLYLKDALIPALQRMQIGPVGVFNNRVDEKDTLPRTYVLIPLQSLDELLEIDQTLATDSIYSADGQAFLSANYDNPPYLRLESTLLHAFSEWPQLVTPPLDGPRADRIYELRSYESPTESYGKNKIEMFNAGGEVRLFERLGCNAVFYGQVVSGSRMPNLMYMTAYSDSTSRDQHWDAFFGSPEWKSLISNPYYDHNVNHADIWLLYPTEFSEY